MRKGISNFFLHGMEHTALYDPHLSGIHSAVQQDSRKGKRALAFPN
jgi:hypothetical protein